MDNTNPTTYTVNYDLNGGAGNFAPQNKVHGIPLMLHSASPSYSWRTFLGWSTSINGNVIYHAGDSYTANADITLYAVWKEESFLITKQALLDMGWNRVTDERVADLRNMQIKYGITTLERARHFFGQCGTESGDGWLREGEYLLVSNGGSYTQQDYENYYNTQYSYGYKYRGCGYIQTTFNYWYYSFATYMISTTYPELNITWRSAANTDFETLQNLYDIAVTTAINAGKSIKEYTDIVDLGCDYTVIDYAAEISGFRWNAGNCNAIVDNCETNGIDGDAAVEAVTRNIAGYNAGSAILALKISSYNRVCDVIK